MEKSDQTLFESFFNIPEKIYKEIKDDVYRMLEKIRLENRSRLKTEKCYKLDFRGTQWEFLHKLADLFDVCVEYSTDDAGWYRNSDRKIHLGLNNANRVIMDTLEHEIGHFIQYRIKDYKVKYTAGNKDLVGGLPPREYSNLDNITVQGYKKGSNMMRRTTHAHRPIEIYTDILSAVRSLQYQFQEKYPDYDPSKDFGNDHLKIHETNKWEKIKKEFFVEFLKALDDGKRFGNFGLASHLFGNFKEISSEFFRFAKKKAYIGFMNYSDNFSKSGHEGRTDEIKNKKDIEQRTLELGKSKTVILSEPAIVKPDILSKWLQISDHILKWDEMSKKMEKPPMQLYPLFSYIAHMIGIKDFGKALIKMPKTLRGIKKTFQRLKICEETKYPFTVMKEIDIDKLDLKNFYKILYENLSDVYDPVEREDKDMLLKLIDYYYNDPKLSVDEKAFKINLNSVLETYMKKRSEN